MNKLKTFMSAIKLFGSKITGIKIDIKNGLYRINYSTGFCDNELLFDDINKANKFLRCLYKHSNTNTNLYNNTISNGVSEIRYNHQNMTQMYYFRQNSCPVYDVIESRFDKSLANTVWNGLYGFGQNKYFLQISEPYNIVQIRLLMACEKQQITKETYKRQKLDYQNNYNIACEALNDVYWNGYELSANGLALQHKDFEKYKKIRDMFIRIAENRLPFVR